MRLHSATEPQFRPAIEGFSYADLHDPIRLEALHERFLADVRKADADLGRAWDSYRAPNAPAISRIAESDLLVRMAPHVSRFLARTFAIEREAEALAAEARHEEPLFRFKVEFVRRRALLLLKAHGGHVAVAAADRERIQQIFAQAHNGDRELALAKHGCLLLDRERAFADDARTGEAWDGLQAEMDVVARWCAAHVHDHAYKSWVVFRFPENVDPFHLVPVVRPRADLPEALNGPDERLRRRDGFKLTDERMTRREVESEISYCLLCHSREKDSCSTGLRDKTGAVQTNPLGIPLAGCPLDEKISEMHTLEKQGDAIGALALVMIDNPMCPGTGHRICNDCMKSCIYQKQEPVNIPQIETGVLTDVLKLPWGVEIYGLLSRWNPLNRKRPYALPYNGKNVLVVGLGPAGYTLAHYLLNEGFGVVGMDGLKIEPLPERITGENGSVPEPVREWRSLYAPLDERVLEGFGGVSEYGITVRWDKNFLSLVHLTLARRSLLKIYGGIRFGGTVTIDDAWNWGRWRHSVCPSAGHQPQ